MILRKNFLPRSLQDAAATLFMTLIIPITYWFEVWIVFPAAHPTGSGFLTFNYIAAVFLMFNIAANFLAVIMYDTSIQGEIMKPPDGVKWKLCAVCETLVPLRSWHCAICNACVLKRDHHCIFTGCCIGHKNHRYFIIFVMYLFLATTYASIYNNYFIWVIHGEEFRNWSSVIKIIFPLAMLLIDLSSTQYYLAIYLINMVGMMLTGVLLIYHGRLILNGAVVHGRKAPEYDLGYMKNMKIVLGERWYLTWLSPFVKSPLPHDGIYWESVLQETMKNR